MFFTLRALRHFDCQFEVALIVDIWGLPDLRSIEGGFARHGVKGGSTTSVFWRDLLYCFLSSFTEVEGDYPLLILPRSFDFHKVSFGYCQYKKGSLRSPIPLVETPDLESLLLGSILWLQPDTVISEDKATKLFGRIVSWKPSEDTGRDL